MKDAKIRIPDRMLEPTEILEAEGSIEISSLSSFCDIKFDSPVEWSATLTNTGGAILVRGTAKAVGKGSCARCLEDAQVDLLGDIEGYYVIGTDSNDPDDLEQDEFDRLGDDKVIDLEEPIKQALLLDVPIQILCSDDCAGLCPQCGQNLNMGTCNCSNEDADDVSNPFAVLKNLKLN